MGFKLLFLCDVSFAWCMSEGAGNKLQEHAFMYRISNCREAGCWMGSYIAVRAVLRVTFGAFVLIINY